MHPNEVAGHRIPGYMDYARAGLRPQLPVERKWALGLQVSDHVIIWLFERINCWMSYLSKLFFLFYESLSR
jgi:hypothetical protein